MKKMFTVEETFNKQNGRVYSQSSMEACKLVPSIKRDDYPTSVVVWWDGVASLHFCEKGIQTPARNYQRDILKNVVKSLNQTMSQNRSWIFQLDSAPAHKAKTTQQ